MCKMLTIFLVKIIVILLYYKVKYNSISFSITKFVRMKNIFPLIRTTQEKQRQKDK